jgi:hypothetical protein
MPIRINLLAEEQAAEESRRRDPVKRAIWIGVFLVALMLVWISSLQVKVMLAKGQKINFEGRLALHAKDYQKVQESDRKLAEINGKLAALNQFTTNRFLHGNLLNAMQQTFIGVDNVQLTRLKVEQTYAYAEGTKDTTNGTQVVRGKPATVTERISLRLEAKDAGPNPGDQIGKFKSAIASHPYFQNILGKTNEVTVPSWPPAQVDPDGRSFVPFTLGCTFPDRTR